MFGRTKAKPTTPVASPLDTCELPGYDYHGMGMYTPQIKRFHLERKTDSTGVSGVGVVAEGVRFADGSCCMRWRTATSSTAVYGSVADLEAIHGHGGDTVVKWLDT